MGYREMDLVWKHSQATRLDKFVLLAIAKTYNKGKGSYPSQGTLAKMTGIADARGIRRSLQRLTNLGELVWVRGSNNSGKSNVYFITFIEQDVAKMTAIEDTKMTAVNDQNDRFTSDQNDPLLNKGLDKLLDKQNKLEVVYSFKDFSPMFWVSCDKGFTPLHVSELLKQFDASYACESAYTDEIRLSRWWTFLDNAKRED